MARPRHDHPTPAELEALQVLWDRGPLTVRQVMDELNQRNERPGRAYTSLMSLLNVMVDKGLLKRTPYGRAFLYAPRLPRQRALSGLLHDLLKRAFAGSASLLVAQLLNEASPSQTELTEIRKAIAAYQRGKEMK